MVTCPLQLTYDGYSESVTDQFLLAFYLNLGMYCTHATQEWTFGLPPEGVIGPCIHPNLPPRVTTYTSNALLSRAAANADYAHVQPGGAAWRTALLPFS